MLQELKVSTRKTSDRHRFQTVEELLGEISESDLIDLLMSNFRELDQEELIGSGESILPGDVTGQLVLDRSLGELLLDEALKRNTEIDLLYSLPGGDLEDFHVLRSSKGFFTSQKGRTTFCPVQASCEGVPAVVGVNCSYQTDSTAVRTLTYEFHDGSHIVVEQPVRSITFQGFGQANVVQEGEWLSMSGRRGEIFKGRLQAEESSIMRIYRLLSECYLEAIEEHGPAMAEQMLTETDSFAKHQSWLVEQIDAADFQAFQEWLRTASEVSDLKVFSTAHTAKGMALTRLFFSRIWLDDNGQVQVRADALQYGLGLLRDERMWHTTEGIDLMRMLFLGEEVVGSGYAEVKQRYLDMFIDMLEETFQVGVGDVAVVRLLCMPFKMIFAGLFDSASFARKYGLNESLVDARVKVLASETETYHGCRGVRLTVQREDICELWCEGVIRAAKRANEAGVPTRLQILLSMVTFPQEVEMFFRVFDRVTAKWVGPDCEWLRGVSVMIETSGAYHLLEDIMSLQGRYSVLNGALFGGNDFTAACLNINRTDSANLIIPNYVNLGLMEKSPFQTLHVGVVGKAIQSGLRRLRKLKVKNGRDYLMGLGGEIAGDWDSVQWLAREASVLGLDYVSTPPERILFSLFASAQAALEF